MRDKVLFGMIGLLVGIVVMQWTMSASNANYVPQSVGIIGELDTGLMGGRFLDQNGKTWTCRADDPQCWQPNGTFQPPVPMSDIKFCGAFWVITMDNHFWKSGGGAWQDCGAWPGSPVSTDQSTWGKVKAKYGGKGDKQ